MTAAHLAGVGRLRNITPSSVDAYVDKIQIWFNRVLPPARRPDWLMQALRSHRAHLHRGEMRFRREYIQRLQLRQPEPHELQWLSRLDGVSLNGVEFSLDWTFEREYERDDAFEFITRHHVTPGRRGEHVVRWIRGKTRYSGAQGAPNLLVMYADKPSRISGKPYCLHLDWRLNGTQALRRIGIEEIDDLLSFDYQQFWEQRLTLYQIDTRMLGRLYHQHVMGRGRRKPWVSRRSQGFCYDHDRSVGNLIFNGEGKRQNQIVFDLFHTKFNVRKCLRRIEIPQSLLPVTSREDENDRRLVESMEITGAHVVL